MNKFITLALRILIIVVGFVTLFTQIVITFNLANEPGGVVGALPFVITGVGLIACVQVALVATWALVSMVRRDAIFSSRAFRWVNAIIGAGIAATVILAAFTVYIYYVVNPELDAPGVIVIFGGLTASGAAFTLLMVVMRSLLRKATGLKTELEEVV